MITGTDIVNDMMDGDMMGWGLSWLWIVGLWMIQVVVAVLVYQDAQKRGRNGLLWSLLILVPMLGWVMLILYVVMREGDRPSGAGEKSAGALLDDRYARGEISRDEYLRMKEDLRGPGEPAK